MLDYIKARREELFPEINDWSADAQDHMRTIKIKDYHTFFWLHPYSYKIATWVITFSTVAFLWGLGFFFKQTMRWGLLIVAVLWLIWRTSKYMETPKDHTLYDEYLRDYP